RIGAYPDVLGEQTRDAFQDAAFEMTVVRVLKDPDQRGEAHREADGGVGESVDERSRLVEFPAARKEDGVSQGLQRIHESQQVRHLRGVLPLGGCVYREREQPDRWR